MEEGKDVNVKDGAGLTPLHFAIHHDGDAELIKALLDAGADVLAADTLGLTPLHFALNRGVSLEAIKSLSDAGADINAPSAKGLKPLHMMAWAWDQGMERNPDWEQLKDILAGLEFDVDTTDGLGRTALQYAAAHAIWSSCGFCWLWARMSTCRMAGHDIIALGGAA